MSGHRKAGAKLGRKFSKAVRDVYGIPPGYMIFMAALNSGRDLGAYDFHAFGSTESEAIDNVLDGWKAHAHQVGVDPYAFVDADVTVIGGPLGTVFRDGQPMNWNPEGP